MKRKEFRNMFRNEKYVCTDRIYRHVPDFDKRRLVEWKDKWYIVPLKRKWYLFSDVEVSYNLWLHLAHVLYRPSYISLYSALSYYQLIPETVVTIQSVSSRKTSLFHTPLASWSYQTCKPEYYTWYKILETPEWSVIMADVEKAFVDLLYYFPDIKTFDAIAWWRLDTEASVWLIDESTLRWYAHMYNNKALVERTETLLSFLHTF